MPPLTERASPAQIAMPLLPHAVYGIAAVAAYDGLRQLAEQM